MCDNACNTMTLYIFSGEGKKVSTVHQKSNPAKIRSSRVKPSVKAQSSWTWWNADVRALSPISILFFVDPFVSKLTSTRSSMFRPSFTGSEMRWDSAKFLFYFIYLFFSWFNFNRNIFFYHLVGQILRFIIPDDEMIVWISRRVGRFRATSGEFAKMEASRENSGEIGGAMRYRDLARARPNFSESLRT